VRSFSNQGSLGREADVRLLRTYVAVAVTIALTIIAWYFARLSIELYDSTRFEAIVDEVNDDLAFQMQAYVDALTQTRAMFSVSDVTRQDFEEYVRLVGLIEKYPGIQGIGYTVRVAPRT
jgi:CHASE1-domain containing sensor protein